MRCATPDVLFQIHGAVQFPNGLRRVCYMTEERSSPMRAPTFRIDCEASDWLDVPCLEREGSRGAVTFPRRLQTRLMTARA